jgi:predicted enzyme related to lactoylglutathione lyase
VNRPSVAWAEVTIDCLDTERVGTFWAGLLDVPLSPQGGGWFRLGPLVSGGPIINFQPVPEPKVGKTRIHLDVWVDDLDAAVALVVSLGGSATDEVHVYEEGTVVVMADPEDNVFCVVARKAPT